MNRLVLIGVAVFGISVAVAAVKPSGRFERNDSGGGGTYIVGSKKVMLSREDARTYKSATCGDADAQYKFAKILLAKSAKQSFVAAEAFAWGMESAIQGNSDGENYIGVSYMNGDGVPKSLGESEVWLKKSAEHGSAKGMYNLALLYIKDGKPEKAAPFARKSAVAGYAPGQGLWAEMNESGQGTPIDLKKAVAWYMKAQKQGDVKATVDLAICYHLGKGITKNAAKAAELYEQAILISNNDSQKAVCKAALANLYFSNTLPNGKALAFKWAMEALQEPKQDGRLIGLLQYIIGDAYYRGESVKKDDKLAREYLEKSSARGESQAKTMLQKIAEEQRNREERQIAARKAAEEAEQRRRKYEAQRIAEEEREERRELARQRRERGQSTNQKQWDEKAAILRRQYDALLSRYGLTESLFSVDNGCYELILLGEGFNEKYRIDYYLNGGYMTHTGSLPASVARQLVTLRVRIWIAEY